MKSFSEKYGFKPTRTVLQSDSMDEPLRNGLWNVLFNEYLRTLKEFQFFSQLDETERLIISVIWGDFFNLPLDDIQSVNMINLQLIKGCFLKCVWNEVYDLVQFCANLRDQKSNSEFKMKCNRILEREMSGYRFIGDEIAPISSEVEIAELEKATSTDDSISTHLKTALILLSDKESPDYRNSIKESISAVEALCRIIIDNPKATLGEALDKIKKSELIDLHPALNSAFEKLYGYMSDKDGIRHALLDGKNELKQEDAIFMLVACSTFVNYLKAKIVRVQETKK